jgi:hypothetical protein
LCFHSLASFTLLYYIKEHSGDLSGEKIRNERSILVNYGRTGGAIGKTATTIKGGSLPPRSSPAGFRYPLLLKADILKKQGKFEEAERLNKTVSILDAGRKGRRYLFWLNLHFYSRNLEKTHKPPTELIGELFREKIATTA